MDPLIKVKSPTDGSKPAIEHIHDIVVPLLTNPPSRHAENTSSYRPEVVCMDVPTIQTYMYL